ncbi:MAG: phenylalanine--tRNA ligase subunit beta [Legionella sp.]|nr:MAG: phenylalanine--tRNA ligase subunit beta [Legionella sp.]
MKISESWLREWVNPPLTTQDLANQLTMAGLEVEAVVPVAGEFDHVVVAKVVQAQPHPQADRLTLCDVDAGDGQLLRVVCGATNVRSGLLVALAKIGAHLPGDLVIKETKLRGELSQGMLCAATELGLTDRSEGIMELAEDAPIGTSLRDYLNLDDDVFDLNVTPNRGDCLSVLGVARDVAALNQLPLRALEPSENVVTHDEILEVQVISATSCPAYTGRLMTGINPHATTPLWIKERLRRADLRSGHPVVDVLNYVMLELGQPMHAFDRQQIQGNIHVRPAQKEEQLTLLGGQDVVLDEQVMVIADDKKVLAMAGIIGGEYSAVQADTTDIWLESAFFDPIAIAGVARRFGLSTDASHRYERGVDPKLAILALERATSLLHGIVGGEIGPVVQNKSESLQETPIQISFDPNKVMRLSGMDVPKDKMQTILEHLGMTVIQNTDSLWLVHIPSYRFDVRLDVDLVEEIIRVVGYDRIPTLPVPSTMQVGTIDISEQVTTKIMQFLAHRGYRETISYSFVDPALQQTLYPHLPAKSLLNPISSELSDMRVGLWSGLLASMLHNIHRQQPALKLCETGKVFLLEQDKVEEKVCCAGLIMGEYGQFNWSEQSSTYDFYDMKGDLQALFTALHHDDIRFMTGEHPALHPGKTAKIMHGSEQIGWIGALHPRLLDVFDLSTDVILFELMISSFQEKNRIIYQPISKYPQIRRDLSLLLDESVSAESLEAVVRGVLDPKILKSFYVFDVYTGGGLALEHKKSVALGMVLQHAERTLTDADINTMMTAVVEALEKDVQAVLRTVTEV